MEDEVNDLKAGIGSSRETRFTVEHRHTVPALPLDLPELAAMPEVLATPMLVAMAEAACVAHIHALAGEPALSVGTRVELDHLAATPVGCVVALETRLAAVEGRQLTFDITASDGIEAIARARHGRVLVDRERFAARLAGKAQRAPR
jgi:predicted thioesterase